MIKALSKLTIVIFSIVASGCVTTAHRLKDPSGNDTKVQLIIQKASSSARVATVVIGHGSGGVTENHLMWAGKIKSWGYNVVIIDHYSARGISTHVSQVIPGATPLDRARDFANTLIWVRSQDWHQGGIALLGFSQGGSGVLAYANSETMARLRPPLIDDQPPTVAVAFYPGCMLRDPPETPRFPILMLLAEKDNLARPEECGPLSHKAYSKVMLSEATHSFDEALPAYIASRLPFTQKYNQLAVDQASKALQTFLTEHLPQ